MLKVTHRAITNDKYRIFTKCEFHSVLSRISEESERYATFNSTEVSKLMSWLPNIAEIEVFEFFRNSYIRIHFEDNTTVLLNNIGIERAIIDYVGFSATVVG